MDPFGEGSGFNRAGSVAKKRRSITIRRPRPDSHFAVEGHCLSPPSSTPSSDTLGDNVRRKEFSLNGPGGKIASLSRIEGMAGASKKIKREEKKFGSVDGLYGGAAAGGSRSGASGNLELSRGGGDLRRSSEGVLAPANWKSSSKSRESGENHHGGSSERKSEGHNSGQSVGRVSTENKLRKVKLKVGGITRTIHAKSNEEVGNTASSVLKPTRTPDSSRRQKLILQDNSDDDCPPEKGNGAQGVALKDFSTGGISKGKDAPRVKLKEDNRSAKQSDDASPSSEPLRKSKRVPKRRVLDGALDEADEDDEIRYLEKLKSSKIAAEYGAECEEEEKDSVKKPKLSKIPKCRRTPYEIDGDYNSSRSLKDEKRKSKTGRESDDTEFINDCEEEPASDDGPEAKKKKQKRNPVDPLPDTKAEPLTTRQRALQSGKANGNGTSLIEFPNGLPPAPSRTKKQKLSEVEQQAKKAEAAQRRRLQVEKQNREIQAAAISKILGHDSKKKKNKEKEERAKEKGADSLILAPNSVRWVMGPTGTTVTFGDNIDLPTIFNSKPSSYPPPREKCAGPSCTNAYKYRDSKSNLPLCSLQCYKAVRENPLTLKSC